MMMKSIIETILWKWIKKTGSFFLLLYLISIFGCQSQKEAPSKFKTKHVVIVVIDGPRYTETWGDSTHAYTPRLANDLSPDGVYFTDFFNNGQTRTVAGHTAITTGNYQGINNRGDQLPQNPSIFQYWLEKTGENKSNAWVVTSKDKLEVLANCHDSTWHGKFNPYVNSGVDGLGVGSGYRHDTLTMQKVLDVLAKDHPKLMLINFREPDRSGHKKNWEGYLKGIRDTDQYVYELYQFIENDPTYAGTTTMLVTNDHGRHLDGVNNGFVSHGCDCEGCRHINLFAFGPDFKKGQIENTKREQIDIPATVAHLLDFEMPTGKGQVMFELFE